MIITKTQKEKYNRHIIEQYKDELASFDDLLEDGYDELSGLFYMINRRYMGTCRKAKIRYCTYG